MAEGSVSGRTPKWVSRYILHTLLALGLLLSIAILSSTRQPVGADEATCRMVWMSPSYARIKSFDETHTKFASKYSLYLYREQDLDPVPNENDEGFSVLEGIPVLFIPGNAGSYRQGRSIASETSNLYFDEYVHGDKNLKATNFDFFTADFNEDFTAFHGRTLLDQAEYLNEAIRFILHLYANNESPPKSVIILAHSMGGIVARTMLSLPNYPESTVNTIISLASPHSTAPLTFDGDLLKIYTAVDKFWSSGFPDNGFPSLWSPDVAKIATKRLSDVTIVSITGGSVDGTLPADYTTLGFVVPPSHGFTVFTTGMPHVWTTIDHLAIVWCAQLRRSISRTLLEIADKTLPQRTISMAQRMSTFRKYFLSGFEKQSYTEVKKTIGSSYVKVKLDSANVGLFTVVPESKLRLDSTNPIPPTNTFSMFQKFEAGGNAFSLLTSRSIERLGNDSNTAVLLCNRPNDPVEIAENFDYTSETTENSIELNCLNVNDDVKYVPRSHGGSLDDSSFGGSQEPYYALQYDEETLSKFEIVLVKAPVTEFSNDAFLAAEIAEASATRHEFTKRLSLFRESKLLLPADRPLLSTIKIPGSWSSMLVYKLKVRSQTPIEAFPKDPPFISLARQWISSPYESRWHINVDEKKALKLSLHGVAPYVPFLRDSRPETNIDLWSSFFLNRSPLELKVSVDYFTSLKLILLRYRIAIVSVSTAIAVLVFAIQIREYGKTSKFPNFMLAMARLNSPVFLSAVIIGTFLLNLATKNELVQVVLGYLDPASMHLIGEINTLRENSNFKLNHYFLGLEEVDLWYLGVVLYLVCSFFIFVIYLLIETCGYILTLGINKGLAIAGSISSMFKKPAVPSNTPQTPKSSSGFSRKIAVTVMLMGMIAWYLPYQIGYIIAVLIQASNVLKAKCHLNADKVNYQVSILILMIAVLPVNIPIVVVFVHNLTVSWTTPFSSHHNILSILPILFLSQLNNSRLQCKFKMNYLGLLRWFAFYFAAYSIIYGTRHTFWLHHVFNVFSCLLILSLWDETEQPEKEMSSSGPVPM